MRFLFSVLPWELLGAATGDDHADVSGRLAALRSERRRAPPSSGGIQGAVAQAVRDARWCLGRRSFSVEAHRTCICISAFRMPSATRTTGGSKSGRCVASVESMTWDGIRLAGARLRCRASSASGFAGSGGRSSGAACPHTRSEEWTSRSPSSANTQRVRRTERRSATTSGVSRASGSRSDRPKTSAR